MSNKNETIDPDLKALNMVYDELSKDARTIAKDLGEDGSAIAYFLLGFYIDCIGLGLDYYMFLNRRNRLSNISFPRNLIVFVNLIR
jgi:hypothetical protein